MNFARVDQFAIVKLQNLKLLLVNTHDPYQNAIVRSQRAKCASEVYGSVFVCLYVCVDCYSCSRMNQVQVRVSIGFLSCLLGFAK